jgi:murein L,D-transpeptidase YafK
MIRIALLLAMLLSLPLFTLGTAAASEPVPVDQALKQKLLGSPVYIQIFKQERKLELYAELQGEYRLIGTYGICDFSGGLGNKRREGDFKSPEGFYSVDIHHLKPDSKFYRAINIGFPNAYDMAQGYSGKYLMIHGNCKSIGCYAMTDQYMDEIFTYVQAAFQYGQRNVQISIYPFRMTDANMAAHRNSSYISFWNELKPGYDYFQKYHTPPNVVVSSGKYVLTQPVQTTPLGSQLAFTTVK